MGNWFTNLWRREQPVAQRAARPVSGVTSGRPTYAGFTGATILPREQSFTLLAQFRANVPPIKRASEILSGFVGCPCLEVEDNEAATAWLQDWAQNVEYGYGAGRGLATWQSDLIDQALTYGFSVGEAEIGATRQGVTRLWTYLSPSIGFRADQAGAIEVVQSQGGVGLKPLNPETVCRVTHGPKGCNPNGESMLLALPLYCQTVLDIVHALRATWQRTGQPTFHINWEPPEDLSDPEGLLADRVASALGTQWNEAMRSQAVDGIAKDFFSGGKITVQVIGVEGEVMAVDVPMRAMLEQIIAATGIPPFMFGLSWASTERMSKQQADMLMQTIDCIRREVEGAIRKVVDLHVRLSGRRDALKWKLTWPDVSLQDQVQTAQAANLDAQAALATLKFWTEMWRLGLVDQLQVAAEVAGLETVAMPMDEPPVAAPALQEPEQPNTDDGGQDQNGMRDSWERGRAISRILREAEKERVDQWDAHLSAIAEAEAEYPGLGRCAHNGKH